jgi:glycosyltransferase involved in cell wall biosynthesis
MNIAVDARVYLTKTNKSNPGIFLDCVRVLAVQKKEHRFFIIYENLKPFTENISSNLEYVSCPRFGKKGLLRKFLPDLKLPAILKKIKADVLISFDKISSASLLQILVLSESGKINEKTVKDASLIIVNSDWHKTILEKKYKPAEGKIETIPAWPNEMFTPNSEEEKEKTKEKYSVGKEFFLYSAKKTGEDSFLKLLKSFSHFKKRQRSSLKLILLSKPGKKSIQMFENYKYRNDVIIMEELGDAEEATLTAASYAVIISQDDRQPVKNTLNVLQSGVSLIAFDNNVVKEIAGKAALYVKDDDELAVGEKMICLYTDETLRNQLINQGKITAAKFTQQKAADSLWHCIGKTVK